MLNPKSLSRHLREHRLDSQKFFCRYPKCKRASVGQGFKRKETRDRHIRSCKSAPHRNGSESPSSITRVSKAGYASASLARGVYRRKDDLLQRAESFSSLDGDLPMNRLAILSEIAELQRWRHDAGPRIIELHALCQTNQVSVPEGSDQVLLEALEELVKLQDFDSQFSRRIQDLNASPFR